MPRFARPHTADAARASNLELFYDLVFVFAITQVSHTLLGHLDWEHAGQAAIVLLAVWSSWNYTTWTTNELDTDAPAVRAMVVAVMLGSLLMAIAIPEAWGERALLFAGAYVAIHVGRHAFLAFAVGGRGTLERSRALHILVWFLFSGVFWIAGALAAEGAARTTLWLVATLIDLSAPFLYYRVPGMSRMTSAVWEVTSEHFSERFQLFVIIALGESIVITGATTSELELSASVIAAFVIAFGGSAALWWLYFNRTAAGVARKLEQAPNRTQLARDVYTYMHVLVIAGIILAAIGDELVIAHPDQVLHTNELVPLIAGPVVYLLALALIRWRATGQFGRKRPPAAAAIIVVGLLAQGASALVVSALIVAVLVALILAEELDIGPDRDRRTVPTG